MSYTFSLKDEVRIRREIDYLMNLKARIDRRIKKLEKRLMIG